MVFNTLFRLQIITDTDNKVKLHVVMDLLAKTIITPPKIILNSEYLPRNLKRDHLWQGGTIYGTTDGPGRLSMAAILGPGDHLWQ